MPRSRSDFNLSRIHAYLNDNLPFYSDSTASFSNVRSFIPPHLYIKWPVVVDLPESTWPITTKFICYFYYGIL